MANKKLNLTDDEIARAFQDEMAERFPVIISPAQLAELLGYSCSTIYEWMAQGRFDGAYRRRGKHARFWRDRAIAIFFNTPEWTNARRKRTHSSRDEDQNLSARKEENLER